MDRNTETIEISVNGKKVQTAGGTTIAQLLSELEINTRAVAVELNEEIQPKAEHDQRQLSEGDWLEIVTLVGGG